MSSDLFRSDQAVGVGFRDISLESGVSDKVLDTRLGQWVSEEGFREEDDELYVSFEVRDRERRTGFRNSRKFCRRRTWK
jgi:hypothetical protein